MDVVKIDLRHLIKDYKDEDFIKLNYNKLVPPSEIIEMDDRNHDHPEHYGGKQNTYEAIKVIESWELNFHLGNVVKYISRAGKKTPCKIKDLEKALWYLEREINNLKNKQ